MIDSAAGNQFPPTFKDTVRKMFRFFFHIIAHIYYSHFQDVSATQTSYSFIFVKRDYLFIE